MIQLPFAKKTEEDITKFLSVSISSRDIRCIVFYFDNNTFKIIGSNKQDLPEGCVRNGMILTKDTVVEAIKTCVSLATEDLEEKICRVIVGVDGGATLGLTTTVRLKRPSNGPMQASETEDLYKRIMEASSIQARNKVLQNTGNTDIKLESITTSEIYLKIDGQNVAALEGQHGDIVEAAVYNCFAHSFHIRDLQNVIKKSGLEIIAVGSQMYSIVEWIKKMPNNAADFVLISVAEDSTDVGVVFGGGIISTKTLNIGYEHFITSIATRMGLSNQEAEAVVNMYTSQKLTGSEMTVVKSCLDEILGIWLDGLKLLFEDFSGVKTFAPTIFLVGCGTEIPDVIENLKNKPWTKTVPFKAAPEFSKLTFSDLTKIVDSTGKIQTTDWLHTAATAIIYEELMGGLI